MSYEEFIHYTAVNLTDYLPQEFRGYDSLIKVSRLGGIKNTSITITRGNVEHIQTVSLYQYYLKYKAGMQLRLIIGEIVAELLMEDKDDSKSKNKLIPVIIAIMSGFCILCFWQKKRGEGGRVK